MKYESLYGMIFRFSFIVRAKKRISQKLQREEKKKCFSSAIKHVRWTRFSRFYARIFFLLFSWHMKRGASSLRHKTRWALSCCWGGEVDAREDEEKKFFLTFLVCVFSLSSVSFQICDFAVLCFSVELSQNRPSTSSSSELIKLWARNRCVCVCCMGESCSNFRRWIELARSLLTDFSTHL